MSTEHKYYRLEPETPGQLGERTKLDNKTHPPKVLYLNFTFDGWLGDEVIECFPCFLITNELLSKLGKFNLTGFSSQDAEISYSELFSELYPNREMPQFKWFIINGNVGDDFFINDKNYLIVSHRAMDLLTEYGKLDNCEVEEVFM